MAAPAPFVPSNEHVVGSIEKEHTRPRALTVQLVLRTGDTVEEVTGAHVDDQPVARRVVVTAGELRDLADEHRRETVDDEEPEVFENVCGLGPSGTGHTGDDQNVERSALCRRHREMLARPAPWPPPRTC